MKIIQDLTTKQAALLKFLQNKITEDGRPPTLREIGQRFGFKSTGTTRDYLSSLAKKGYLKRTAHRSRSIELSRPLIFRIPILGRITAGKPDIALEEIDEFVYLDELLPSQNKQMFALKIKGDSMIGRGIFENDVAIVKKQLLAQEGDIVAALIDHEATIKILKKQKDEFFLAAANNAYPDIHKPFTIMGRVVAVLKKF